MLCLVALPLAFGLAHTGSATALIGPAATLDGPSSAIIEFGNAAMASDGSGGVVYVKAVNGVPHVFACRFVEGTWSAPIRVDRQRQFEAGQPRIAAGRQRRTTGGLGDAGGDGEGQAAVRVDVGAAAGGRRKLLHRPGGRPQRRRRDRGRCLAGRDRSGQGDRRLPGDHLHLPGRLGQHDRRGPAAPRGRDGGIPRRPAERRTLVPARCRQPQRRSVDPPAEHAPTGPRSGSGSKAAPSSPGRSPTRPPPRGSGCDGSSAAPSGRRCRSAHRPGKGRRSPPTPTPSRSRSRPTPAPRSPTGW